MVVGVVEPSETTQLFFMPLHEAGVAIEAVTLPGRAFLRERREVRARLRRARPDIVHTHSSRSDLLDGPVARALGVPIVSTVHGSSRNLGKSHLFEWMQRRAWRHFDGGVFVSRALEMDLRIDGTAADDLALILNAWFNTEPEWSREQARHYLRLETDAPVLAFVGRLIPAKRPELFVQALADFADQRWQVLFRDGSSGPKSNDSFAPKDLVTG